MHIGTSQQCQQGQHHYNAFGWCMDCGFRPLIPPAPSLMPSTAASTVPEPVKVDPASAQVKPEAPMDIMLSEQEFLILNEALSLTPRSKLFRIDVGGTFIIVPPQRIDGLHRKMEWMKNRIKVGT